MPKQILITGASGLVGSRLTQLLIEQGHRVSHLSRSEKKGPVATFVWDIEKKIVDPNAFNNVDTIIHLAGANVADKRWNEKSKKEIADSRILSTQLLYNKLKENKHEISAFVCASAIGYYGFTLGNELFKEESGPGNDFLAEVVKGWEAAADQIASLSIRVVKVRTGIVLSKNDGALKKMALPVKLFVGSPLASGKQYISWIHIDDLCGIFIKAVDDNEMVNAYNGVAPHPVTNQEMTVEIAQTFKRPLWAPNVPAFALKVIVGEMADLVINGSNVSSSKIERARYQFKFPDLRLALRDLLL